MAFPCVLNANIAAGRRPALRATFANGTPPNHFNCPMLEIKNLTVGYGAITALHGISLQIKPGDIVTLIGANGAGKTTTLRAISGLLRARGGEATWDGRPITNPKAHEMARLGIWHVPE